MGPGAGLMLHEECVTSRLLQRDPADVLLVRADGTGLTAAECIARTSELAERLAGAGVRRGDRVAVVQALSVDAVLLWWALDRLGAVYLPLNPTWTDRLAGSVVALRRPVALVVDEPWRALADRITSGTGTRVLPSADLMTGPREPVEPHPALPLEDCCIVHNSGLPGIRHGVRGSWRQMATMALGMTRQPASRVLVAGNPCFMGVLLTIYTAISAGGSVALLPGLAREDFWPAVRRTGVTYSALLNPTLADLMAEPESAADRDHPLTMVAADNRQTELNAAGLRRFGFHWVQGLGKTEVCGAVSTDVDAGPEQGVGRVRPPYVGAVVDVSTGAPVGVDEPGELVLRCSVEGGLPAGYADDEAASAHLWRGGWLHTGWHVRQDADGWLHGIGDLSTAPIVIKRAGYLYGSDLEEEIVAVAPGVTAARVAVTPGAGPLDDPVVAVWVTGSDLDRSVVLAGLRAGLPAHLVPDAVIPADVLPDSPDAAELPSYAWSI